MLKTNINNFGLKLRIVAATTLLVAVSLASASLSGSPPSEKATQELVAQAIADFEETGSIALADMSDPQGKYLRNSLYIFVIGPENTIVAHAANPERVGVSSNDSIDADGLVLGPLFRQVATKSGAWVSYKWEHPTTAKPTPKRSWLVLHRGFIFGAGIYEE